ncbi:hypothetical protein C8R46DRAFT_1213535 [Mycena filopes]|nr:hypothetical protein C8R46DRAFT_1213535 [Mycena filopes]
MTLTTATKCELRAPDPILPPDLEREIFEWLALAHPRDIPSLLLVARRVKIWTEPLLYRTLSVTAARTTGGTMRISEDGALKLLGPNQPASFLYDHVRRLAVTNVSSDTVAPLLSKCSGTQYLAIYQTPLDPTQLPLIAAMPVRRLSVDLTALFGRRAEIDLRHSLFQRLTHWDIFETDLEDSWMAGLAALPCLTHISFNTDLTLGVHQDEPTFFRTLLADCKSLEVLILVFLSKEERQHIIQDYTYFGEDPRSVLMVVGDFLADWELGATGGADCWMRAEIFIRRRRSGEVRASEYSVPF